MLSWPVLHEVQSYNVYRGDLNPFDGAGATSAGQARPIELPCP
jgi:hypothetical protein